MKKKLAAILVAALSLGIAGCTESDRVSHNISVEADNFNVRRSVTVFNTRTDTVLFQMIGTMSISNNDNNELEVIVQTGKDKFKKHFVYLGPDTTYVIEDVSGADVDKYKYEISFLPEWGWRPTIAN